MVKRNITVSLVVCFVSFVAFAAEVPDIRMGSKFYIENKSQSDESMRFAMLLAEKLGKDEGNKRYQKPGFPVVEEREGADYIIKFSLVVPGAPHIRGFRMCGIKSRSSYLHSHSFQKQE